MSMAACGGSDGGDDKKWKGDVFDKLDDQLPSSSDEYDDDDLDRMNISSAEEETLPDAHAARSRKRGSSPHNFPRKSKLQKKLQTDLPINKSKEMAKKEEQLELTRRHRKQIARDRVKALCAGASTSHYDQPMAKISDVDGDRGDHGKDVDMGEMADDSKSEGSDGY